MTTNQKQFRYPFSFENRKPMVYDRVLFIPDFYQGHENFDMPQWSSSDLFGNDHPVIVEFCSGNGEWIIQKAINEPHHNFVASEKMFKRVRKIWAKIKNHNLQNVIIACGDANTFVKHYLKDDSIDGSYMNFPDPWPKEKHEKNRLVRTSFIEGLKKALKNDSKAVFVTDHDAYAKQILQVTSQYLKQDTTVNVFNQSQYGESFFQRLWMDKGKSIHMMEFVNVKH